LSVALADSVIAVGVPPNHTKAQPNNPA
jgi:hypothetical protein